MTNDEFTQWMQDPRRRPLIMGVLNVTPDSFSDGGRYFGLEQAVAHARQMCDEGADLLDVGGESTRPGSAPVDSAEQIRRILPVIERIVQTRSIMLSVDTTRSDVARAALDAGAKLINDISAGRDDPAMLALAAARGAPIVLMHMQGKPATMQSNPTYADVVSEVRQFLQERIAAAQAAGVGPENILIDPGIGFGKTMEHNLLLMRELSSLAVQGRPMVAGVSRKRFIGRITGEEEAGGRVFGTAASVAWSAANGASILRVHEVKPMKQVVRMVHAIQTGGASV